MEAESGHAPSFGSAGGGLLRPPRASKMPRLRSGVRRNCLSPTTPRAGRWRGAVRQSGGPFQPAAGPVVGQLEVDGLALLVLFDVPLVQVEVPLLHAPVRLLHHLQLLPHLLDHVPPHHLRARGGGEGRRRGAWRGAWRGRAGARGAGRTSWDQGGEAGERARVRGEERGGGSGALTSLPFSCSSVSRWFSLVVSSRE